jgi:hypothetical protein
MPTQQFSTFDRPKHANPMTFELKTTTAARALVAYLWALVCALAATALLLVGAAIEGSIPQPVSEAEIASAWAAEDLSPDKFVFTIARAAAAMPTTDMTAHEQSLVPSANSASPSATPMPFPAKSALYRPEGSGGAVASVSAGLNPAVAPASVEQASLPTSEALKTRDPAPASEKSRSAVDRGDRDQPVVGTTAMAARGDATTSNRKLAQPVRYRRAAVSHPRSATLDGRPKSRSMAAYASQASSYPPFVLAPGRSTAGCPAGSDPTWSEPDATGPAVLICNPYYRRLSVDVF